MNDGEKQQRVALLHNLVCHVNINVLLLADRKYKYKFKSSYNELLLCVNQNMIFTKSYNLIQGVLKKLQSVQQNEQVECVCTINY